MPGQSGSAQQLTNFRPHLSDHGTQAAHEIFVLRAATHHGIVNAESGKNQTSCAPCSIGNLHSGLPVSGNSNFGSINSIEEITNSIPVVYPCFKLREWPKGSGNEHNALATGYRKSYPQERFEHPIR